MAYTKTVWKDYPDTTTKMTAQKLNNIENGIKDVDTRLTTAEADIDTLDTRLTTVENGWVSANETWTYSSVNDPTGVITISGDKTTKYSLGMRIKFTNGGNVIYGIITKIAYSSPNTTLTFLHEINPSNSQALYLMQNSAITNKFVSCSKSPCGFPLNPNKWSVYKYDTNYRSLSTNLSNWQNIGSLSLSVPIGAFRIFYSCVGGGQNNSSNDFEQFFTLSTINNSESNRLLTSRARIYTPSSGTQALNGFYSREDFIDITTKTTYYLLTKSTSARGLELQGGTCTTVIKAVCTYL